MIRRRDLLARAPSLAAAVMVAGRQGSAPPESGPVFLHGVASADPTADGVVIWTRVSGAEPDETVPVRWTVARDPTLRQPVATGDTEARPDGDWTVHVDVAGLGPSGTWWYGFEARGQRSPTGRCRTAPAPDDDREIRLGVVSCASYAAGEFVAYRHVAERDLDLVVHLGDYLYEGQAPESPRRHRGEDDPVTLDDYRQRHAQYKTDPDLQALHQQVAMAAIWDDHEVAGNAWSGGAANHIPSRQGPWAPRREAALRAYLEWVPLRRPDPDAVERIWRTLPLGGSGELILVDTRHDGRDRQVSERLDDPEAALADDSRRIMSAEQEAWLTDRLRRVGGGWRVIANQVLLSPLRIRVPEPFVEPARALGPVVAGTVMNPDQWDGYPQSRRRLLDVVAAEEVGPVVVLTGDIHSSWAFDIPAGGEPGGAPVAVELVTPSVTSETFATIVGSPTGALADALSAVITSQLSHVRWNETRHHGYVVVGLTPDRLQADWWHVEAVDGSTGGEALAASWAVDAAVPRWQPAPGPLGDRPAPVPLRPPGPPEPGEADETTAPQRWPYGFLGGLVLMAGGAILALRRRRWSAHRRGTSPGPRPDNRRPTRDERRRSR